MSTSSDSGTGTGSPRYGPQGSSTGESTTVGIPFATWAIEGGMSPILLARIMGTSVRESRGHVFPLARTDG